MLFMLIFFVSANCAVFFGPSATGPSAASCMDRGQGPSAEAYQACDSQTGENLFQIFYVHFKPSFDFKKL
ncbi:MAG: hypothetical protein C4548_11830 [Desulfobacteraceae bacterium]|jgi:hypothetical protein|nr:MAG: hypothetical protein C4548_11830 [Desulfobacteraceae bacterium]